MQRTVRQADNSPYLSRSEQQRAQRWMLLSTSSIGGGDNPMTRVGSRERLRGAAHSRPPPLSVAQGFGISLLTRSANLAPVASDLLNF